MPRFLALLLAAVWIAVAGPAHAAYPDKPIRYIVPFPAGGVSDLLARALAEEMSKALGQRLIVENLPGASGIIASQAAARAAPDGYTFFQGETVTQVLNAMRKNLPFDPNKAFEPITMLAESPMIIVVPPSSPIKSYDDFIAMVKSTQGEVIFPSGGAGTLMHLTTESLIRGFGAKGQLVSYTGTPRMIQDLMAGELAFGVPNVPPALPHLKSGSLRAVAVLSKERMSNLPDVPTANERLPNFDASNWYALYAPTGVSAEIKQRVGAVAEEVLKNAALRARLIDQGFVLKSGAPAEIKALETADSDRLSKVLAEAGIKLE